MNPSISAMPELEFREEFSHGICILEGFDYEVVASPPEMLMYPGFHLLVNQLSLLKVVCGLKLIPWIPVF
jgi:hypothetical protein